MTVSSIAKNTAKPAQIKNLTTTFNDNLSLPIHRWFRFTAGFSSKWTRELIQQEKLKGRRNVLDPFVGSGTVLLESEFMGVNGIGLEAHPFISRIANTKMQWDSDPNAFFSLAEAILEKAKMTKKSADSDEYPTLIHKCFPKGTLQDLTSLRKAWEQYDDKSPASELVWLALASILRSCSPVGTAQWQYVLPNKSKKNKADPFLAFIAKCELMENDMTYMQSVIGDYHKGQFFKADARTCEPVPDGWADLVITSPPYANNYDYADAMRLEMCFFGEIGGWCDLQDSVRKYLMRSCTQHVSKLKNETMEIIADPLLSPIYDEIEAVCSKLDEEKEHHGGKKNYHTMVACYFLDMANVWQSLRRVTTKDSLTCFVIGDSAPYGIYVPVDKWIGKLALSAGFTSYEFEKTRDRNVKWKNRKHDHPLHEGRLWVNG